MNCGAFGSVPINRLVDRGKERNLTLIVVAHVQKAECVHVSSSF
jgi:hypothetical protein